MKVITGVASVLLAAAANSRQPTATAPRCTQLREMIAARVARVQTSGPFVDISHDALTGLRIYKIECGADEWSKRTMTSVSGSLRSCATVFSERAEELLTDDGFGALDEELNGFSIASQIDPTDAGARNWTIALGTLLTIRSPPYWQFIPREDFTHRLSSHTYLSRSALATLRPLPDGSEPRPPVGVDHRETWIDSADSRICLSPLQEALHLSGDDLE